MWKRFSSKIFTTRYKCFKAIEFKIKVNKFKLEKQKHKKENSTEISLCGYSMVIRLRPRSHVFQTIINFNYFLYYLVCRNQSEFCREKFIQWATVNLQQVMTNFNNEQRALL